MNLGFCFVLATLNVTQQNFIIQPVHKSSRAVRIWLPALQIWGTVAPLFVRVVQDNYLELGLAFVMRNTNVVEGFVG